MNIGEAVRLRILELCKKNHITVNKLSTICGITQSTLNNIIGGRNNMSRHHTTGCLLFFCLCHFINSKILLTS